MARGGTAPALGADRFLVGIVVGAVVLALVGVVAALVASRGPAPPPPDPASPAGVVQRYAEALRRGDWTAADALMTASARSAMNRDRFPSQAGGSDTRVYYETTKTEGDTAEVRITVSRFSARSSPFSSNTYTNDYRVVLVRENGEWRINQPLYPYMFW